jgi:hypothetical protein
MAAAIRFAAANNAFARKFAMRLCHDSALTFWLVVGAKIDDDPIRRAAKLMG